jgi:hypothetical protein
MLYPRGTTAVCREGWLIRAFLSPFRLLDLAFRTGVNFALGKPDVPG